MRLLRRCDTGEFTLTEDLVGDEAIPPYAILSHTWAEDAEEVTFKDLTDGTGKGKPGYKKIRFCRERARQDDLQYFWIDTCCINKANKAELSQAINSMFRWYRNATRCYVYYRMSPALLSTPTRSSIRGRGNRISGRADGSLGVGRSKSFLPLVQSNSSPENTSDLVIKVL
ncbi:HET-domain-containing protein [Zopfia rhizophila CBS 207.26]|uniref:HET-domain-containing protein n=1 Tax=Zopfia rhizophila CBS 207.26 TaxID=1314779 RepID=A0A6A6EPL8_9PEZI|nr:HET-domain-containing protein [Zopfia rhizophila CBS 207.26]